MSTTKRWLYQPLTLIRQTGIKRHLDGTTIYLFVAFVRRDLPPVRITLTVTTQQELTSTARFDEHLREMDGLLETEE